MFLLGFEKVSLEYPSKQILDQVSLGIDDGARIGIVGSNACGKSTLLRLLAGLEEPDDGRVVRTRGVRFGLLQQSDSLCDTDTVGRAVVGDAPEYEWAGNPKIRDVIVGLLFDIPWDAQVGTLSGGQRRRVDLARLLCGDWDILALDEPTNHLDVRTINWLAQHLKSRWKVGTGVLLVVTHDRWFLDEVALDMWELYNARIEPFEGGFSAYIMQRVERQRQAEVAEQKRQNLLRRELAWLSRGARARATKPKFHVAAAQALIADVPPLRNELELKRMAMARIGKQVVDMENASVTFASNGTTHAVLKDITWLIGPGDRIGIVGQNGAGKTTLLRLIQGLQEPTRGTVKIGKTVRFAFLSQGLEMLTEVENDRVREVVSRYPYRTMLDGKEQTPAQLLENLGFAACDLKEPVRDLSGGQRRRLALMMILLSEPNVLILDEPGNDLDIDMLAAMESLLDGWPGTLILVTHDRYLMERVTDNQYALMDGKLVHLPGGIDEYLKMREYEGSETGISFALVTQTAERVAGERFTAGDAGAGNRGAAATGADVQGSADRPTVKLSGGEIRALRKTAESTERKMATVQGKIEAAREQMAQADQSDYVALDKFQQQVDDLQEQLSILELEWLDAMERLGE